MRLRRRVSLTHRRSLNEWALTHGFGAVSDLLRDVADMEARLNCIEEILTDGVMPCTGSNPYAYDFQSVNVAHGIARGRPLPRPVHLKEATR